MSACNIDTGTGSSLYEGEGWMDMEILGLIGTGQIGRQLQYGVWQHEYSEILCKFETTIQIQSDSYRTKDTAERELIFLSFVHAV